MGNATASRGLEVAVANLQDYCNGQSLQKIFDRLMPGWDCYMLIKKKKFNFLEE